MKLAKALVRLLFVVIFLQGAVFAGEANSAVTPEQAVRDFYSWYIDKQDSLDFPVLDLEISKYVTKATVKKLKDDYSSKKYMEVDYFTKVQDYDSKDWIGNINPGKFSVSKGKAKGLVTFGSLNKSSVKVYLIQESGVWKVTRVDSVDN